MITSSILVTFMFDSEVICKEKLTTLGNLRVRRCNETRLIFFFLRFLLKHRFTFLVFLNMYLWDLLICKTDIISNQIPYC